MKTQQIAKTNRSPLAAFADTYSIDPQEMEHVLKTTVFRQKQGTTITNEQMVALMIVAKEYNLNPFTKEIYAFPSQNGIVPIVGVDGWSNLINSNKHFDGMEFKESETLITIGQSKPCPEWIECVIYRDDRTRPTIIREYLDETHKATIPWNSHTKRMLRHKAMIQCARIAFSLSGIYEEDEAHTILENELKEINPLPETPKPSADAAPVSQSRTEQLVKSVGNKKENNNSKSEEKAPETTKQEMIKPKKLTAATKNRLIKDIKACETIKDLDSMVPELSSYDQDSPVMIPVRVAWKEKKESFKP